MMDRMKKLLSTLCIITLLVSGTGMAFAEEVEAPVVAEESATVVETVVEEVLAAVEPTVVEEIPVQAVEETPVQEAPAVVEETPVQEVAPAAVEETPAQEVAPAAVEETPAQEEAPAAVEETPAQEEASAVVEDTPAQEETPTEVEETPAEVEETPASEVTETPSETEASVADEKEQGSDAAIETESDAEAVPAEDDVDEIGDDFVFEDEEDELVIDDADAGYIDEELIDGMIPEVTDELKYPESQELKVGEYVDGYISDTEDAVIILNADATRTVTLTLYYNGAQVHAKVDGETIRLESAVDANGQACFTYDLDVVAGTSYTITLSSANAAYRLHADEKQIEVQPETTETLVEEMLDTTESESAAPAQEEVEVENTEAVVADENTETENNNNGDTATETEAVMTEEPAEEETEEPAEETTEESAAELTEEPTEEPEVEVAEVEATEAPEATEEPVVELTEEPTEEPEIETIEVETTEASEATEEPVVELTEEPTEELEVATIEVEATEAPEATEEPVVELTEEPTEEPEVEAIEVEVTEAPEAPEATEEPTEELTEEPTAEPEAEATEEPTSESSEESAADSAKEETEFNVEEDALTEDADAENAEEATEAEAEKSEEEQAEEENAIKAWVTIDKEEYAIGDQIVLNANADEELDNQIVWQTRAAESEETDYVKAGYGLKLTVDVNEENAHNFYRFINVASGIISDEIQLNANEAEELLVEYPDEAYLLEQGYSKAQVIMSLGTDAYADPDIDTEALHHFTLGTVLWIKYIPDSEWVEYYQINSDDNGGYVKLDDLMIVIKNEIEEEMIAREVSVVSTMDNASFVAFGSTISMSAELKNFKDTDICEYQWQVSTDDGITWTNVHGANSLEFSYSIDSDNWYYIYRIAVTIVND